MMPLPEFLLSERRERLAPIGSDGVRIVAFGTLDAPMRLDPSSLRYIVLCDCGLKDDAGKIQFESAWNGPQVLKMHVLPLRDRTITLTRSLRRLDSSASPTR